MRFVYIWKIFVYDLLKCLNCHKDGKVVYLTLTCVNNFEAEKYFGLYFRKTIVYVHHSKWNIKLKRDEILRNREHHSSSFRNYILLRPKLNR